MKEIKYYSVEDLLKVNYDIKNIINKISDIMKIEYPGFENWFIDKFIPELYLGKRNIIIACKDNEIIGFVNLKKKNNEKTISNIYIKSSILYNKIWNNLIDISIKWLETPTPKLIIPYNKLNNCVSLIIKRNWKITGIANFNGNNHDMIFNGKGNEIERLLYKKKILINCKNKINYK